VRLDLPVFRKEDVRLPGKENSNSHGARPVHLIITMIKWTRTSRFSIKNSLSTLLGGARVRLDLSVLAPRARLSTDYRGISLISNTPLLGPYGRTIPRVVWWS